MTLELKHIAPYLPYGLKFELLDYQCDYVGEKYGICNGFYFIGDGVYYTFKSRDTAGKNNNNCKPILRPLSDLNRSDLPINEHTINTILGYDQIEFSHYKGALDFIYDGDPDQRYDSSKTIEFSTFEIVRTELLKGHYDVFGLIEKGLAIDINTIK